MSKLKTKEIILSGVLIVLGVSLILYADKVTSALSIILGVTLIVMGLINAVSYFKETKSSVSLILGTVEMAIGIFLIVKSSFLKEFISFIIGVYILLSSIAKLVEAIDIQKETGYSQKRSIILSAIGMGIAILCGIGKIIVPDMFLKLIGLLILIYGIINIVNLFILNKTKKDNKLLDVREVKIVEEKVSKKDNLQKN